MIDSVRRQCGFHECLLAAFASGGSFLAVLTFTSAPQVYEVLVPTDDDKFLRQALHMLAEFATEIRCAPGDLDKERGAVLEVGNTLKHVFVGNHSRRECAKASKEFE